MCELTYFPTTTQTIDLHKQFRFWHTESLLNQSANLIDQCLKDLTELKQLELIEFNLGQEISRAEKELEIEENKLDSFDRDLFINQNYYEELKARYPLDLQATGHAQAATTYIANVPDGSNEGRHLTNIRDVITMSEREITDVIQKHERLLTEKKEGWFADDKIKNTDYFFFRKEQLKNKKEQLDKTKALDFSYQKELCLKRLTRNYEDALNRAVVAEDGLAKIYGRPVSLDSRLSASVDVQFRVTELHNWIYESVEFVMAYSQLDQSFTACLSLRSILLEAVFQNLHGAANEFTTNFKVSQDSFPIGTHQNIRFKGIGASLLGKVGTIPWKIEISLPKKAVYLRGADDFEIDQSNVPNCILGRVENRSSIRGVEFGGMVSLNNISPIASEGNDLAECWSVKISKPKSSSEMFQNIEDIIIELNLTGKLNGGS